MSEGDLASWIVAGSFASKAGPAHAYNLGLSYSTQGYQGGNPIALAAMRDGSRNAAEVFAFDRWRVTPWLELDYGAHYARYGYIDSEARTAEPPSRGDVRRRVRARVFRRSSVSVWWCRARRSSCRAPSPDPRCRRSARSRRSAGQDMRAERARGLDFLLEHQFGDAYVIGIRRFYQSVDEQLVTMFSVAPAGDPESIGHYYVGNAGVVRCLGLGVQSQHAAAARVADPSTTASAARELDDPQRESRRARARRRSPRRPKTSTTSPTSVSTDIPETATRFYVLYRDQHGVHPLERSRPRPASMPASTCR